MILIRIILEDNLAITAFNRVLKAGGVINHQKLVTIVAALVCPPFLLLILVFGLVNLAWFCIEWCIHFFLKKGE